MTVNTPYLTGTLSDFSVRTASRTYSESVTVVRNCGLVPSKTYWVYVTMANGAFSRTSQAVRVRSEHDIVTLPPKFNGVASFPVDSNGKPQIPAGWTATPNLVGPTFKVDYYLREEALASSVSIQYVSKTGGFDYTDYPYGKVGRLRRLRSPANWAARRTHDTDDLTSLRDRTRTPKASFESDPGFGGDAKTGGVCGDNTFTHVGQNDNGFESYTTGSDWRFASGTYTAKIGYQDHHGHGAAFIESTEFEVDTDLPALSKTDGPSRDATLATVTFQLSETGTVYWRRSLKGVPGPTAASLALDAATLDASNTFAQTFTGTLDATAARTVTIRVAVSTGADYVIFAVPVDRAGNIGALTSTPVPAGGGTVVKPPVTNGTPPRFTKIIMFAATKIGAVFKFRTTRKATEIFWFAVEGAGQPMPKPYATQLWNKEMVDPASEIFMVALQSTANFKFKSGTTYSVFFADADPTVAANRGIYAIVEFDGMFATLAANAIEYTGYENRPILGTTTTGLLFNVKLGSQTGSVSKAVLDWGLAKGGREWTNGQSTDPNGMEKSLLKPLVASKDVRLAHAGQYKVPVIGAGDFKVGLGEKQQASRACVLSAIKADPSLVLSAAGNTVEDQAVMAAATKAGKCDWALYYLPIEASLVVFETNPENVNKVVRYASTLDLKPGSAAGFTDMKKQAFCSALISKYEMVGAAACKVTNVEDVNADGTVVSRAVAGGGFAPPPTEDGMRRVRRLALTPQRRRLGEGGVRVSYELTLSDARDMARAQVIFEEMKKLEQVMKDPVLQTTMIKALTDAGVWTGGEVGAVVGAGKPKSSHVSDIFTKPSFGFDAKPLEPINQKTIPTPIIGTGGDDVGMIVGVVTACIILVLVLVGAAVWWFKLRGASTKGGDGQEGMEPVGAAGKKGADGKYTNPMWTPREGKSAESKALTAREEEDEETLGEGPGQSGGGAIEDFVMDDLDDLDDDGGLDGVQMTDVVVRGGRGNRRGSIQFGADESEPVVNREVTLATRGKKIRRNSTAFGADEDEGMTVSREIQIVASGDRIMAEV